LIVLSGGENAIPKMREFIRDIHSLGDTPERIVSGFRVDITKGFKETADAQNEGGM